jgi:two-component system sensor kinase FixL
VLDIVRGDLRERGVEVVLELDPGLPTIDADRVQLQQVLLNLMMNGAEAMAGLTEGRVLTVCTRRGDDAVEVAVADVGHGIPAADVERIFAPFVTSKREGLGLGLAVCTTIIQAHRGALWASNNPGRGATLHFRLPVSAGD